MTFASHTSVAAAKAFRLRFLLGAIAAFGLIALAIGFQHMDNLVPCPLCIFQRVAYAAAGVLFLIGALLPMRSRGARRGLAVLTLIPLLTGMGIAARHVWLTHLPPDKVPKCGPGLEYLLDSVGAGCMIRSVLTGSGECAKVDWHLLGLSMPEWSLVGFAALTLWCLLALLRGR